MKLLKKEVFDISKVTVVGSPTITSDGVASGFGAGNFIDTNYSINTINSQNLNIDISFTTPSDVTTNQYILHSKTYAQLSVFIRNGQLGFAIGKNNAWIGDTTIGTVNNNTRYNLNLNFTTSGVTYTCETNGTTITNFIANTTILGDTQNMNVWLGVTRSGTVPFLGSIDLPSFKVTTNNTTFSPTKPTYLMEKRKEGFDLSKFTVVGSPTITSDGVMSVIDNSNYVKTIPVSELKGKSWTIRTKWINQGITTPNNSNTFFTFGSWVAWGSIFYAYNTRILRFYIKTGTREEPSTEALGKSITLPYDPSYIYASLSFDIDTGVYTCKADYGEGEVLVGTYTATTTNKELYLINIATTQIISIGSGSDNTYNKNATSLPDFSITGGGKEVFTGAKVNYYAMR